jgi:hypothetical protein
MFSKFGYMPTWLPNAPLSLGDVGTLGSDGFFHRVTSLRDLKIDFTVRRGATPLDFSHSSEQGVAMTVGGGADADAGPTHAKAKVTLEFSSKGAFVFQAKGCVESSIEDQAKLGRDVITRFKSGEDWDPDWVVINTVVQAKCATILVSSSTSSKVEIAASGELPAGSVALADADVGLRVLTQTGDVTNLLAQQKLTPLFRVSRIKRGLLARLKKAIFGETEFANVRSIGQVFDPNAGMEPEAPPDPEEESPLEEVTPE